ncbi:helix-turn-helix domain-containing protein [Segnochrobactraceae bacterium EtOH-i3]
MTAQFITTPSGERLVVLPENEYNDLVKIADGAMEDAADSAAYARFLAREAAGETEMIPAEIVNRLLAGENPVRVWRSHRGLTVTELAEKAGVAQPYLSQIETGKRDGTLETMRRIAAALGVTLDDLAG